MAHSCLMSLWVSLFKPKILSALIFRYFNICRSGLSLAPTWDLLGLWGAEESVWADTDYFAARSLWIKNERRACERREQTRGQILPSTDVLIFAFCYVDSPQQELQGLPSLKQRLTPIKRGKWDAVTSSHTDKGSCSQCLVREGSSIKCCLSEQRMFSCSEDIYVCSGPGCWLGLVTSP